MKLDRRTFLQAAAAATAAGVLPRGAIAELATVLADDPRPRAIWLQGSGCDGCAISFLNSVHFATPDEVLTQVLAAEFQSNLMAAAGDLAVAAAQAAAAQPGYILIIEGAIPVGAQGRYCTLWPGKTMHQALVDFAANASFIVALGACASYGGVTAGAPNPTGAQGVAGILGDDPRVVNLPGCPAHPDWLVGTLTTLITGGAPPPLDEHRRPLQFYGDRIHDNCFKRAEHCGTIDFAPRLGEAGCMEFLGCKGKHTRSDCPIRKWNAAEAGRYGVSWCIGARSPCLGCTEPDYPDLMSPFYEWRPAPRSGEED